MATIRTGYKKKNNVLETEMKLEIKLGMQSLHRYALLIV